jgi:hypothetical protein
MFYQSCVPYRGYGVRLSVDAREPTWFEGEQQRYIVSWTVKKEGWVLQDKDKLATFTEPSHFTSVGEALDFGEARAHTFIDSVVASGRHR